MVLNFFPRLKTDYPDLHKHPMYMFGDFNFRLNTRDVIEVRN